MRGHALTIRAFGGTHTGRVRAGNEDSFLVADLVFAVADGMGGAAAGEVATTLAMEVLHGSFRRHVEELRPHPRRAPRFAGHRAPAPAARAGRTPHRVCRPDPSAP